MKYIESLGIPKKKSLKPTYPLYGVEVVLNGEVVQRASQSRKPIYPIHEMLDLKKK